jgi:hypothetical protein
MSTVVRVEPAVLLLYHRPAARWFHDAATIVEQIAAFVRHSSFAVHAVNTDPGFPPRLAGIDVGAVILHYSLFGSRPYRLGQPFVDWLDRSRAYKVCFFSDEHADCRARRAFIDDHRVDCVFSHVEPRYFDEVYGRCRHVPHIEHNIPGYVTDEVRMAAGRLNVDDRTRPVDIGYRGRSLPVWMGRGGREKHDIALEFARRARGRGLVLDIDVREERRLYGERWYGFLASCRCTLGVESGTSYMDLEDEVATEYAALDGRDDEETLAALERGALGRWEGNVPYRTVATRHFEAAAFNSCQILFEGDYSGVLRPMVHYLPLRKDFANFERVLDLQADEEVCRTLTANAFRDLIASGSYDARRLVAHVDRTLADAGLKPSISRPSRLAGALAHGARRRQSLAEMRHSVARAGAPVLRRTPEPVLRALRTVTGAQCWPAED